MIYYNVLNLIGNTPIIRLNNINKNIYLKLEKNNPGGSIKDRAVCNMIEQMEIRGELKKGDILVDATSGNTGIALAMIGKLKGYKVIIVMPDTMSIERRELMKAYGANLIITDGKLGMKGSISKAKELLQENTNFKSINQFENNDNVYAHFNTTGVEILKDIPDVDIFVCGVGTGGTLSGCAKYLKSKNPNIKIIALEPKNSPAISKNKSGSHNIQGIGSGFIPKNYYEYLIDEIILIEDEEAFDMVRLLAEKEGLLVGISSGANLCGAIKISKKYPNKKIVTVAPDGIEKYISMGIFNN